MLVGANSRVNCCAGEATHGTKAAAVAGVDASPPSKCEAALFYSPVRGRNHGAENTYGLPADVWAAVDEDFALSMLRLCARCVLCFNFSEAEFRDWLRATLAADTDDVVANMWDNTLAAAYTKLLHVQSPSSSEELTFSSETDYICRWLNDNKVYAPWRIKGAPVCACVPHNRRSGQP